VPFDLDSAFSTWEIAEKSKFTPSKPQAIEILSTHLHLYSMAAPHGSGVVCSEKGQKNQWSLIK